MQPSTLKISSETNGLIYYLLILTGLFICLEIGVFIQGSELYLGDYKFVAQHLKIPVAIIPGLVFFFFVQFILHITYILFIWAFTRLLGVVFRLREGIIELLGIGVWLFGLIIILLANQYLYPNSKFAVITSKLMPSIILEYVLIFLLTIFFIGIIAAFLGLLFIFLRNLKIAVVILISGCIAALGFGIYRTPPSINTGATAEKPNIILIGVDSLRPDFLGFFGGAKMTPHIDNFLEEASVFSEALTPLARTFPAWVSILTGEYPKITNMRTNLMEQSGFDKSQTLASILRQHGYKTVFAMDDTRSSNIDESFGFDRVLTPPMGFNDFLIGTLNDFPLSNLLVNTSLGQYLFPYSYSNRAAYITYNPNTFLKFLHQTLIKPNNKPLFLSVHFCLPHYPYIWGNLPWSKRYVSNYRATLGRVDQLVDDLLKMLKKNNLLEHSVVVLLSDHGEAIELPGDRITEADLFVPGIDNEKGDIPRFYPPSITSEKVNQSAGHGTDVLGLAQYHSVLGFRFFGIDGLKPNIISGRVSLLDIKPTILNLLKIETPTQSGKSLAKYLSGTESIVSGLEDFFIESDFSPEAIRTVHPETRQILFQGIDYFQINPLTTRLSVKKSMFDLIISSKQYADFYGPWVLALYPQNNKPMIPILVNLETGWWTNDLRTSFAKEAPVQHMLKAMKNFFGEDIKEIENISS